MDEIRSFVLKRIRGKYYSRWSHERSAVDKVALEIFENHTKDRLKVISTCVITHCGAYAAGSVAGKFDMFLT